MALPATGSTITMSDIRNFFVSEGQPSSFVLGVLGTYIGISTGNTVSMSSSFGGLGSSTGSFASSKNFNLSNLRLQDAPPNLLEISTACHIIGDEIENIHLMPDNRHIAVSVGLNNFSGGQYRMPSQHTLKNSTRTHTFGRLDWSSTGFPGNISGTGVSNTKVRGFGWNSNGTTCYAVILQSNGYYISKYTLTTAYDLSTATKQSHIQIAQSTTGTNGFDGAHTKRLHHAQIDVSRGKLWLLTNTVAGQTNNNNMGIRQFSFTGNDPVTNTPTFDHQIALNEQLGDYFEQFQIVGDKLIQIQGYFGYCAIWKYNLQASYDISNETDNPVADQEFVSNQSAGGPEVTNWIEGWNNGTFSEDGYHFYYTPKYQHGVKKIGLTTPFDLDTFIYSDIQYNTYSAYWLPFSGHVGQVNTNYDRATNYQFYHMFNATSQSSSMYTNGKRGTVIGFMDPDYFRLSTQPNTNRNWYSEMQFNQPFKLDSLITEVQLDLNYYVDGATSQYSGNTVWGGYHDQNGRHMFFAPGTTYNIAFNQSSSGSIASTTGFPPSNRPLNMPTELSSGATVKCMRWTTEKLFNHDTLPKEIYMLDVENGTHTFRSFGAAASSSAASNNPTSYTSHQSTDLLTKVINAGWNPGGLFSSPTYSLNYAEISRFDIRHLTTGQEPAYNEIILYATGSNQFAKFSCSTTNFVSGTWTLQQTLDVPNDIAVLDFCIDPDGEYMTVMSMSGILYQLTFDG